MMPMPRRLIDLTYGLDARTPTFAGYPPVTVRQLASTEDQAGPGERAVNSSHVAFGLHCGTHMDAPYHFFGDGCRIDQVAWEPCIGPALLLDVRHKSAGDRITRQDLAAFESRLRQTRRVVLHTGWSRGWGRPEFFVDFPVVTQDAADFLVDCGILLVGLDTPSLDHPPNEAHVALLSSGAVVVENLTNLDAIETSPFYLIALPLLLTGREASPVRAVAVEW
jgi:arylformamidase